MAWPENYNLTKTYWKTYIDRYMEVYNYTYNQMKDQYSKEEALAAAVATVMIALSKAAGMDMAGIVTWDASTAEQPDFKTFAEPKGTFKPTGTQAQFGGNSGGYQKKPYDGPVGELKGMATDAQVSKIHEFLNDKDPKVSKMTSEALVALNVAAPEELSKQAAHDIISEVVKVSPKKPYYNKK